MVFGLGVRHGLDLDHLATIDSITRTLKENEYLSKRVGVLFSLGHGAVVILISFVVSNGFMQNEFSTYLDAFGNWISIAFLFIFGSLTLWNVIVKAPVYNYSINLAKIFIRSSKQYNALLIILIGALFAFSFDTFTQVALFSISMSNQTSWYYPVILGMVFMCGMMASDGLNGFFVALLIQRADKSSACISRILGLVIACFSLLLGLQGLVKQCQ